MISTTWSTDGLTATVTCDCKTRKKDCCTTYTRACSAAEKEETKRREGELVRQRKLIAKPRFSAKAPESAKIHDTLSARKVVSWYGRHGLAVLTAEAESSGPFLRRLALAEERGKPKAYEIIRALPSVERFNDLRDAHYTTTIEDLIAEANSDVEDLASEIRDWHDNMPENLQYGYKGEEILECANALEAIDPVDIEDAPAEIKEMKIVYLPMLDIRSRGGRMGSAIDRYTAVYEKLNQFRGGKMAVKAAGEIIEQCGQVMSDAENISFPGMF
jgi:hypothetical protein